MWDGMMLSGFSDEIDPDLQKQIEGMKTLGICHIEMRGVNGKGLVEYSIPQVREIKKQLDGEGMSLSAIGSPIGKINITEDFGAHMELYKHTVEIAHEMGTSFIRMFSFFMPREENFEPYREEVMDRLGQLVDYAKSHNVVLLHENEKGIYGDTAPRCLEIMKLFYGDHMKGVFDFANFIQCKQNTMEAFEMLNPYLAYVHVKDALWDSAQVVPAGMGDGQVKEILKGLKTGGFRGYLSLEPHLADFSGFSALEQSPKQGEKRKGEETFAIAHEALQKILESI